MITSAGNRNLANADVGAVRELDVDVDDHVLLAADVSGLADAVQDLVCGYPVALGGPLGVEQEAAVHTPAYPCTIADRSANGTRGRAFVGQPVNSGPIPLD
jgi:hypothetical protein